MNSPGFRKMKTAASLEIQQLCRSFSLPFNKDCNFPRKAYRTVFDNHTDFRPVRIMTSLEVHTERL